MGTGGSNMCVACTVDANCTDPMHPVCDMSSHTCVQCTQGEHNLCVPTGAGAACLTNDTCGCTTDADCGGPGSGRICGPSMQCVPGCNATSDCPSGKVCASHQCVAPPDMAMAPAPDAAESLGYQGGGFRCSAAPGHRSGDEAAMALAVIVLLLALGRRKRP
jgi:MYXO-CTERM domain-containing protein